MPSKRSFVIQGKELASRLTGISTPIGGVSWTPPVDERDKATRLLTFLEDRRALYQANQLEVGDYVVQSVIEIRKRLTEDLEDIATSSILAENLEAMRAVCRKFLDETQLPPSHRYYIDQRFIQSLGELRALFGIYIARIAYSYDLEVKGELTTILPPEIEK